MFVKELVCFACAKSYPVGRLMGLCECGKPLRVDYDLPSLNRGELSARRKDLWRFRELLPLPKGIEPKSLGEGSTPLLKAPPFGEGVWIKDEALNPTGSFKARGMAVAIAMATHFGVRKVAVPSAGNAGGAMAAYAALHGLEAHVFMPKDVPIANRLECELYGAKVNLVDGLISDCAKLVAEGKEQEGWFDVSTLKEPYRIEGKKTMGYEVLEQLGWRYPDVILYPTGGGTGLIGMWKAFEEMEALGWVSGKRPRMYSVQAEGCQPIVKAWGARTRQTSVTSTPLPPSSCSQEEGDVRPHTVAAGLRVPKALGDFVILDILEKSGGGAIAVSDTELIRDAREISAKTGVCACPEGGACLSAYRKLVEGGEIQIGETAVLFNTGTGLKYAEAFAAFP